MLKTRIIPTLLYKDVGLVKGVGFDSWRRVGSVLPAIRVYNTRDVDELILVDITASLGSRRPDFSMISEISPDVRVPFTVGGGVRTIEDISELLSAGADKVSINSSAFENLELIKQAATQFGSQCVVASVDVRFAATGNYQCFSHSSTRAQDVDVVPWVRRLEENGAGEILLTSIERDGKMEGYDVTLIRCVSQAVKVPVIASGGCGNYRHMLEAVQNGANAVAAASIFHFTEQTPLEAKKYLREHGVAVRLNNL